MKISIIAFDQFTDIDVYLAWDLFNRIRQKDKACEIKILGTQAIHLSSTGLELKTHGYIEEARYSDVVFFASGRGTRNLYKNKTYLDRFQLNPNTQIICSMCSGALILAGLGLLENLTATTYPTTRPLLEQFGVKVLERPLVTHGNIATAAGCLAAVDLVAWIAEKIYDLEMSNTVVNSVQAVGQGLECIY